MSQFFPGTVPRPITRKQFHFRFWFIAILALVLVPTVGVLVTSFVGVYSFTSLLHVFHQLTLVVFLAA